MSCLDFPQYGKRVTYAEKIVRATRVRWETAPRLPQVLFLSEQETVQASMSTEFPSLPGVHEEESTILAVRVDELMLAQLSPIHWHIRDITRGSAWLLGDDGMGAIDTPARATNVYNKVPSEPP